MRCQVKKGRDASEKEDGDCIGNKERSAEDKDVIKRCKECLCVGEAGLTPNSVSQSNPKNRKQITLYSFVILPTVQ
jgi:hypothetical protein